MATRATCERKCAELGIDMEVAACGRQVYDVMISTRRGFRFETDLHCLVAYNCAPDYPVPARKIWAAVATEIATIQVETCDDDDCEICCENSEKTH